MNNNFQTYRPRSIRSAFTLVELLLVIAIIAILASLGVGVMAQAQNDAAIAATRSRISIIEKILEIELENYEVRRSPVSFNNIGALIGASSLDNPGGNKTLLHAKNLKRMIIADLIRAELPDGSVSGLVLGQFPSGTLTTYLAQIGITDPFADLDGDGDSEFPSTPYSVAKWASWNIPTDSARGDGIDEGAADKAEIFYEVLLDIDVDGVPAIEQLGSQAVGDSDGDGFPEVVDAWGEPLYLQWQQEAMTPVDPLPNNNNVWNAGTGMVGLSKEHADLAFPPAAYSVPVLPTQIRPFIVSERLLKIDGLPADYLTDHAF